jgi:hypothetical protein
MAINPIQAVVFDMGGTLEDLYYDDTIRHEATRQIKSFLTDKADHGTDRARPDAVISDLMQVVNLVTPNTETAYDD